MARKAGYYESLGDKKYYIPDRLPPKNPEFNLDLEMATLYGDAMHQLGKLNEMTKTLPDKKRFIKNYVIKEALLSSAIEGIHTTMLDVFTQPLLKSRPEKNTQLIMNYTDAVYAAYNMIKTEKLPISSRVVLKAHEILLQYGVGDNANPGNYRKQDVRVGDLIPAPAPQVSNLMSQLEEYINIDNSLPPLIKAGLAHVQFEIIHPFMDGNGRIGRLLIVLMLIESNLLSEPILYPSYYFKRHHLEYYQKLDKVRTEGDFEGWIKFYLNAIKYSSIDAYKRAKEIEALSEKLQQLIQTSDQFKKSRETSLKTLPILFAYPLISINELSAQLNMSYNTAKNIISNFMSLGILVEDTQQKRGKLFSFTQYLEILAKEF